MSSSRGPDDAFNRLSAALRELQAQVTEDVLNLRARVLALEQELEEVRGGAKAPPQDKQEPPPTTKAGARGTPRRAPASAAKRAPASAAKTKPKPKPAEAKAPKRSRSKT